MFANVQDTIAVASQITAAANEGGKFCAFTFKGEPTKLRDELEYLFGDAQMSDDNRTVVLFNGEGQMCNVACNGYVTGWNAI